MMPKGLINGVYKLCATYGIPLEVVLEFCQRENYVVNFANYYIEAIKEGHNPRSLYTKINIAVTDIYGRDYAKEFNKRFDRFIDVITRGIE
jgi:alanyl-tRNA synthetase